MNSNIEKADRPMAGKRLLVVEDDPAMRTLLEHYLTQQGGHVLLMADAHSALNEINQANQPYDLLITDINLPGMSGFDLLFEVRRLNFDLPVIFLTGYALDEFNLPAGILPDTILKKPIRLKELGDAVKSVLEK